MLYMSFLIEFKVLTSVGLVALVKLVRIFWQPSLNCSMHEQGTALSVEESGVELGGKSVESMGCHASAKRLTNDKRFGGSRMKLRNC